MLVGDVARLEALLAESEITATKVRSECPEGELLSVKNHQEIKLAELSCLLNEKECQLTELGEKGKQLKELNEEERQLNDSREKERQLIELSEKERQLTVINEKDNQIKELQNRISEVKSKEVQKDVEIAVVDNAQKLSDITEQLDTAMFCLAELKSENRSLQELVDAKTVQLDGNEEVNSTVSIQIDFLNNSDIYKDISKYIYKYVIIQA